MLGSIISVIDRCDGGLVGCYACETRSHVVWQNDTEGQLVRSSPTGIYELGIIQTGEGNKEPGNCYSFKYKVGSIHLISSYLFYVTGQRGEYLLWIMRWYGMNIKGEKRCVK